MEAKKRKYIYNTLRREIFSGHYPLGDALPGELRLKTRFHVAQETVRGALALLADEHLIERIHGKGTFVRFNSGLIDCSQILLVTNLENNYVNIFQKKAAKLGCKTKVCSLNYFRKLHQNAMDKFLLKYSISAIVLCGSNFFHTENILENIRNLSIPVILNFTTLADLKKNNLGGLYYNLQTGWKIALKHLAELGHRKIGTIAPSYTGNIRGYSATEYAELFWELGLDYDPQLILQSFLFNDKSKWNQPKGLGELIIQEVFRMLDQPDPPTAFICTNDFWAPAVYKAVQRRGMKIPVDISVMGFVSNFDRNSLSPALSSVVINYEKNAEMAIEFIKKYQEEGAYAEGKPTWEIPLIFSAGNSTSCIKTQI